MKRSAFRAGFTLVELLVTLCAAALIGLVVGVMVPSTRRGTGCGSRSLKDSTQVRALHQAMVIWSQNHNDKFPLPSLLDPENVTVKEEGQAKDHTANILSPLIFTGTISAELLINPAEASANVRLKDDYEMENPRAAVNPAKALWDPSLSADFTADKPAHSSYAHLLPSGPRLKLWATSASWDAGRAVLGDRGPEIASVKQKADGTVTPAFANPNSNTFLIHGSRTKWEGNIAFEDNHVEFMTMLKNGTYADAKGVKREDVLFFDEPDDPTGMNAFLGIFTRAGGGPGAFKAIWD